MLNNIFKQAGEFAQNKVILPMMKTSANLEKLGSTKTGGAITDFLSAIGTQQQIGSNLSDKTANGAQVLGLASKALESIPGLGTFAKAGNMLTGAMNTIGLGNDGVTKTDALIGSTPLGFLNFGVTKTKKFGFDTEANSTGAFTGTTDSNQKSANVANKTLGWMSSGKAKRNLNSQITLSQKDQATMGNIVSHNKDVLNALPYMALDMAISNLLKKFGGFNPISVGKRGAKLDKKTAQKTLSSRRLNKASGDDENVEQSLIPGGALHAHRHKLNSHDESLAKSVTNKGIPVVTFEEGGEIDQHAEIERGEIIFRLDITEKLEKLWKDGSEEAMIEAGKLISEEVVNNTKDNSGEYEIND